MTRPTDPSSAQALRSAWIQARTEIPMTTPMLPGICPCQRPAAEDGFCDEHTGAVAFKVPIGPNGEALPAVWWHWAHPESCPHGEAWLLTPATADGDDAAWACTHRWHEGEPAAEPETDRRRSPRNDLGRQAAQEPLRRLVEHRHRDPDDLLGPAVLAHGDLDELTVERAAVQLRQVESLGHPPC